MNKELLRMMFKQLWPLFINPVYVLAIAGLIFIGIALREFDNPTMSFLGFAENSETAINLDYDVEIIKVHVVPGQSIKKGDLLLEVNNLKFSQDVINNNLQINIIRAEKAAWLAEENRKLKSLELTKVNELANLKQDIKALKSEQDLQEQLWKGLKTIPDSLNQNFRTIMAKIVKKEEDILNKTNLYDTQINLLKMSIQSGQNPYRQEELKLFSEIDYTGKRMQKLKINAPHDGLVGNVHCTQGEHIDAFSTLITYYEANPNQVKGYVSENHAFQVEVGDTFHIQSVRDENLIYQGLLVGLGSRIVEIPERMRKIPEIKSYGREVVIQIPPENLFLQKEKVVLQPVH